MRIGHGNGRAGACATETSEGTEDALDVGLARWVDAEGEGEGGGGGGGGGDGMPPDVLSEREQEIHGQPVRPWALATDHYVSFIFLAGKATTTCKIKPRPRTFTGTRFILRR